MAQSFCSLLLLNTLAKEEESFKRCELQSLLRCLVHSVCECVCMCVDGGGRQVKLTPVSDVIKVREHVLLVGVQRSGFPGRG